MEEDIMSVRPKIQNSTSSRGMSSNVLVKGTAGARCRSGVKNIRGQIQCNDCGVITHSTEEFVRHGQVNRKELDVKCTDPLQKPFDMRLSSTSDIEMEIQKKLSVIQGPPPSLKIISHLLDQDKELHHQGQEKGFRNIATSLGDDVPYNFNANGKMSTQHLSSNFIQKGQLNILKNFEVQQRMEEQELELKKWKEDLERREMKLSLNSREDEARKCQLEMEEAKRLLTDKLLKEQQLLVVREREETRLREKEMSRSLNDKEELNQMYNFRLQGKNTQDTNGETYYGNDKFQYKFCNVVESNGMCIPSQHQSSYLPERETMRSSHQSQVNTAGHSRNNDVFNSDDEETIGNVDMINETPVYNAFNEEQQTIWNDVKKKNALKDEREKELSDGKEHSAVVKEQLKIFEDIATRNKQKKIEEDMNMKLIQKLCLGERDQSQASNEQTPTDIPPHVSLREHVGSGRIFTSAVGSVKKYEEAKKLARIRIGGLKANAEAMGQFVPFNSVPRSLSVSNGQYVKDGINITPKYSGMNGKDHMVVDNGRTSSDIVDPSSRGRKEVSLQDHWVVCQKKETQRSKKVEMRNENVVKERSKSECMSELDNERRKAAEDLKKRIALQNRETQNKMTRDTIAREWEEANKRTKKEENAKIEMQLSSRISRGGTKEKSTKEQRQKKWERSCSGQSRSRKSGK